MGILILSLGIYSISLCFKKHIKTKKRIAKKTRLVEGVEDLGDLDYDSMYIDFDELNVEEIS